jgi:DNA-nicking Smr family endonuclease
MSDQDENNDLDEFQKAMQDVEPIQQDKVLHKIRKPKPEKLNLPVEDEEEDGFADLTIETGDELLFQRPGIQNRVFSDLRRGYIEPEAVLDLHGMRVIEANESMKRFLKQSLGKRLRCVLIIHGKGQGSENQQPILKQKTNQWLRQSDQVLAFCSAPSWNGGTGATYVLLSRKRKNENY